MLFLLFVNLLKKTHKSGNLLTKIDIYSDNTEMLFSALWVRWVGALVLWFQTAFRSCHSTETALLRLANDIVCNIDSGDVTRLTILDLSATCDTIDHDILIQRLNFSFGISDNVLKWFKSYLSDRQQKVKICNTYSDEKPILFGVPQVSVLGPLLFTM